MGKGNCLPERPYKRLFDLGHVSGYVFVFCHQLHLSIHYPSYGTPWYVVVGNGMIRLWEYWRWHIPVNAASRCCGIYTESLSHRNESQCAYRKTTALVAGIICPTNWFTVWYMDAISLWICVYVHVGVWLLPENTRHLSRITKSEASSTWLSSGTTIPTVMFLVTGFSRGQAPWYLQCIPLRVGHSLFPVACVIPHSKAYKWIYPNSSIGVNPSAPNT